MRKRLSTFAAVIGAGALVLSGCAASTTEEESAAPTETATSEAPAELKTIVVWADEQRGPALEPLLQGNTDIAPGYEIELVIFSGLEALQSAWDKASAADGPDVLTGPASFTLAGRDGRLLPLALSDAVKQDLGSASLGALSLGGNQYGVPLDTDTTAFYWNTAFGEMPSTFADLVTVYEENRADLTGGVCFFDGVWGSQPFLTALGGGAWEVGADGAPDFTTVKLNSDEFKANLVEFDLTGANSNFAKWDGCGEDFKAGKIPAANTGSWNFDGIVEAGIEFELGAFPGLAVDTKGAQWVNYSGAYVTAYAADHDVELGAKALVAEWMASPEGQLAIATAQERPAVSSSAAESLGDNLKSGPFTLAGATGMAQFSAPLDNSTGGANWYEVLSSLYTSIFVDGDDASTALDEAAAIVAANFAEGAKALAE